MQNKLIIVIGIIIFILSSNSIDGQRYSESDIVNIRADLDSFYSINRYLSNNYWSLQKLNENYCMYKASNNFDLDNYFNIIMDDRITVTSKRLRFLQINHYCLSEPEISRAKNYLLGNIDSFSHRSYAQFVSLYNLESIAPNIPSVSYEDIFDVIKNKNNLNREQKNALMDYAVLANLGKIDEDEFIQFVFDVFNLKLEQDPIHINSFFSNFLAYCLPILKSKNSIISTIDVFLDDRLVQLNNDYNSADEISFSIAQEYINYCVKPKILFNGQLSLLFFDIDNNLEEIKDIILSDKVIWKSEVDKN